MTQKQEEFLKGLEELTKKTGLKILSCGCCDSMILTKIEGEGKYIYTECKDGDLCSISYDEGDNHD